jgi:hypothetical protein
MISASHNIAGAMQQLKPAGRKKKKFTYVPAA